MFCYKNMDKCFFERISWMKFVFSKENLGLKRFHETNTQMEIIQKYKKKFLSLVINHANDISPRPPATFSTGQFDDKTILFQHVVMKRLSEIQLSFSPLKFMNMWDKIWESPEIFKNAYAEKFF